MYVLDSNTLPSLEHSDRKDPDQLEWLSTSIARSRTKYATREEGKEKGRPWRIVTLHHPMRTPTARGYLFGIGGHQEDPVLFGALVSTLRGEASEFDYALEAKTLQRFLAEEEIDIEIDAVFAGHNHFYARLTPGVDGIRHFVSGGGGIAVYEPDLKSVPTEAGGGFHHFVTAVISDDVFEYCVIDSLGWVRDHGSWRKDTPRMQGKPWSKATPTMRDKPLSEDRYRVVCRP